MSGKIALLSDIHGNTPALRAVLDDVARQDCARVFVLGDFVNGVDPAGCVEIIRAMDNVVCIKGNAESSVLTPDLAQFSQRSELLYARVIRLVQWIRAWVGQGKFGMA